MTSRKFFGNWKFKDIHIELFNAQGDKVYENKTTTFAHVNPTIQREIDNALEDYKKNWEYKGQPTRCEIFTTPAWNACVIDLITNKKKFATL